MNWLKKIGNILYRFCRWAEKLANGLGWVKTVASGLSAIGIILCIVYLTFAPQEINCLRADLTLRELEECIFKHSTEAEQRTLQDRWIGKWVTGIGKPGTVLPGQRDSIREDSDHPKTIMVLISPWGPEENGVQHLIECWNKFSDVQTAAQYWDSLQSLKEAPAARFKGMIKEIGRGNLVLEDCVMLEDS